MKTEFPLLPDLVKFILERESVRVKKERGDPWPWTTDPMLRVYRFCNVRREDDKETRLIHKHWLTPHRGEGDLWFAMAVARLINWWPTLDAIGWPLPWADVNGRGHGVERFIHACDAIKKAGGKVFTGAYMVRADPHVSGSKATYLAMEVLTPMWVDREHVRPRPGDTLAAFHARLMLYKDMGPFIAGQIVADTKWGLNPLHTAKDRHTWATPGPGSIRGLNRVMSKPHNNSWTKHNTWEEAFQRMRTQLALSLMQHEGAPNLDAQNMQNCLCEFDKHQRAKLGQGRPRALYSPDHLRK